MDTETLSLSPKRITQANYETHPYYRIPTRDPSISILLKFDGLAQDKRNIVGVLQKYPLDCTLALIRDIFSKDLIGLEDIKKLVAAADKLLCYASVWKDDTYRLIEAPNKAVYMVARQLLLVDALWCICEVIGPGMERDQWWGSLMRKVKIPENFLVSTKGREGMRPFLRRAALAFEENSAGRRPSAREIVGLKRQIFKFPCIHSQFTTPRWNAWRKDDDASQIEEQQRGEQVRIRVALFGYRTSTPCPVARKT